jgi:hypothetical protein
LETQIGFFPSSGIALHHIEGCTDRADSFDSQLAVANPSPANRIRAVKPPRRRRFAARLETCAERGHHLCGDFSIPCCAPARILSLHRESNLFPFPRIARCGCVRASGRIWPHLPRRRIPRLPFDFTQLDESEIFGFLLLSLVFVLSCSADLHNQMHRSDRLIEHPGSGTKNLRENFSHLESSSSSSWAESGSALICIMQIAERFRVEAKGCSAFLSMERRKQPRVSPANSSSEHLGMQMLDFGVFVFAVWQLPAWQQLAL